MTTSQNPLQATQTPQTQVPGSATRPGRAAAHRAPAAALLALLVGSLLAACGGGPSSDDGSRAGGGTTPGTEVTIKDVAFTPATLTVAVGATVTWTNQDAVTHTVTADDGTFDSASLAQGATFTQTFQTAGTYAYHCNVHPGMAAKIVVR